ncbi:MAG: hypothetical protein ABSH06_10090 [Thermodesulfobacteriota bacterium]|jgi:hypothetical protein
MSLTQHPVVPLESPRGDFVVGMRKMTEVQAIFRTRFLAAAEKHVAMSRYSRGFLSEVARSLKLKQVSVVQRWTEGYMPSGRHLVTIYDRWGITPNHLLGIER